MAAAIEHRGPDEEGFFLETGVGLASRRLSIVGLADGQQPMFNEDGSVVVVFNGELFEYPELRAELQSRGHVFRTHADTEVLVHLWEEMGETFVDRLKGQFAFALYDRRKRVLILARDRVGICPLHWTRQGNTLYFGSEIKAILASGKVAPRMDVRGMDHLFTYMAMGSRRTMFEGISAVQAGSYLKVTFKTGGRPADLAEHIYFDLDFPDWGDEYRPTENQARDEFRAIFERSVDLRLRADVSVVSYLSGGVDSTTVAATISRMRGQSLPTFTIQIDEPKLDETPRAFLAAQTINARPTVLTIGSAQLTEAYPELVRAADCPVVDTSCAAMLCLAREVHRHGYRVALTGEGADEALAGYPWFKATRLLRMFDVAGVPISAGIRRIFARLAAPEVPYTQVQRIWSLIGGRHAVNDLYGFMTLSRHLLYSRSTWDAVGDHLAYEDLHIRRDRVQRWHPLNRALYLGYKTMLTGLLMTHKGDRPAMNSSVETRYPFLDEQVIAYCARIHPRFKLRGIWRDKHLLRLIAAEVLPSTIANRPKAIFRAPFASTFFDNPPEYINQLLSSESMERTGLFDSQRVTRYREEFRTHFKGFGRRLSIEMGLTTAMATQLWHHLYLGGGLCDLPAWSAPRVDESKPALVREPPEPAFNAVAGGR
jgi:asparagine synthase (glutamine-hydrolysing)